MVDDGIGELAPSWRWTRRCTAACDRRRSRTLMLTAGWVRGLNEDSGTLHRDQRRARRLVPGALGRKNAEATDAYSLHTTGWSFDILREYESDAQASAFQFVLDRLQALGVIDYAVEPSAIHVTVSGETGVPGG